MAIIYGFNRFNGRSFLHTVEAVRTTKDYIKCLICVLQQQKNNGKEGVLVNRVEPGRALTQMVVSRFSAEHLVNPGVLIGRCSEAEEVAEVVEFLISESNTYTSGSVWSVKGGTG